MPHELTIDVPLTEPDAIRRLRDVELPQHVLFVPTPEPFPPISSTVTANLILPGAASLRLRGLVSRHIRSGPRGSGVELRLMKFRASDLLAVESAARAAAPSSRAATPPAPAVKPPPVPPPPAREAGAPVAVVPPSRSGRYPRAQTPRAMTVDPNAGDRPLAPLFERLGIGKRRK